MSEAIAALGDPSSEDGLQYQGKIIAVLDDLGRAEWVIFDSNTPVSSSDQGGFTDNGSDTRLPSYTDLPVRVETSGHVQTGNGRYDASTGTLYLQFTGLTNGASNVDLGQILVQDSFGSGRYYTLNDVDVIADNNTASGNNEMSYVVELDFNATELTGNYIVLNNTITVTTGASATVNEWYVAFNGTAKEAITGPTTMKNNTTDVATWTVKMPEGVTTYGITNNGTDNLDAVGGLSVNQTGLTTDATIKCTLHAVGTQPILGVNYNLGSSQVTSTTTVKSGSYSRDNGVLLAYFDATNNNKDFTYNTADTIDLTVNLDGSAVATSNQIVVEYYVNGSRKTETHTCTAGNTQTVSLDVTAAEAQGSVEIEVTSVKLQSQITTTAVTAGNNITAGSDLAVSVRNVTSGAFVDVGETVTVVVTIPATRITGNGTIFTLGSESVEIEANSADTEATFQYVVQIGTNTVAPTTAAGNP